MTRLYVALFFLAMTALFFTSASVLIYLQESTRPTLISTSIDLDSPGTLKALLHFQAKCAYSGDALSMYSQRVLDNPNMLSVQCATKFDENGNVPYCESGRMMFRSM